MNFFIFIIRSILLAFFFVRVLFLMVFFPIKSFATPSVGVSIKPLHSLVAAIMEGRGSPFLIIKGTGSEHGYHLRPEDAQNLANADLIFFVSEHMEGFLVKPLQILAAKAGKTALAEVKGVTLLSARNGGSFEEEDNYHHGDFHHPHLDFHFWLDPQNAKAAVSAIATILRRKDPQGAELYQKNADNLQKRLDALISEIDRELEEVRGHPFIVFHDAYYYFEERFAMPSSGSITVSSNQLPSAKRIAEIRKKIKNLGSICVFSEPQFEPRIVQTIIDGTNARTAELDPLGFDILEGTQHYFSFIRKLAFSLKNCLAEKTLEPSKNHPPMQNEVKKLSFSR